MSELQLPQLLFFVSFFLLRFFFLLVLRNAHFQLKFQIKVTRTGNTKWIVCMARTKWDTKLKLSKLYLLRASEFKLRATIAFYPFCVRCFFSIYIYIYFAFNVCRKSCCFSLCIHARGRRNVVAREAANERLGERVGVPEREKSVGAEMRRRIGASGSGRERANETFRFQLSVLCSIELSGCKRETSK